MQRGLRPDDIAILTSLENGFEFAPRARIGRTLEVFCVVECSFDLEFELRQDLVALAAIAAKARQPEAQIVILDVESPRVRLNFPFVGNGGMQLRNALGMIDQQFQLPVNARQLLLVLR